MLWAQAYLHLGELKKGENDKAGAAYYFSAAYYYRGLSEAEQMQTTNALADLTKAIELRPNFPMAYYDRGRFE
jgi:tetratricopeptide (TPR) repeat protein